MARKVHRVVENAQDIHSLVLVLPGAEYHEVTSPATFAGNVEGRNASADLGPLLCAQRARTGGKGFYRKSEGFGIDARLRLTEALGGPAQDLS